MDSPVLTCPEGTNNTGAYRISWSGSEDANYRLQEDGQTLYEGPHQASTVTGRVGGTYEYRVGVLDDSGQGVAGWSASCRVEVNPPSLTLAFGLFGMGLLVFVAVLGLIVRGHRRHRQGELG